jgi:Kef-type K+ transport system membrane component KefB
MRKVILYSFLLFAGLGLSQALPSLLGDAHDAIAIMIRVLTLTGLAFIMIHVGFEFHIDKSRLGSYGWDYVVAFTAASFPWIFVTGYFVFVMLPVDTWGDFAAWKETLLAGRFAAPTSAGILFSMLTAAGLGATWLFRKARTLAIFDDLDTVLLMIPLKMLMVGVAWQLGVIVFLMATLLIVAYVWLHRIRIPVTWAWVLGYGGVIVGISELLYAYSSVIDPSVSIHIEVLLPAFVLGCLAKPRNAGSTSDLKTIEHAFNETLERPSEQKAATVVSAAFMFFVGLSMPAIFDGADAQHPVPTPASLHAAAPVSTVDDPAVHGGQDVGRYTVTITARQPNMSWDIIALHVLVITLLSNLGKMFPVFCYRKEVHWRHRLALAIGMWPRGEVGAGVLVLSLSYGIGGPIITVAMLSLALNLALTGVFILLVKKLIEGVPEVPASEGYPMSAGEVKSIS